MHRLIKVPTNERGQSMVELALSIVVIMILLAGTIDLGRAFFTWLAMRDAAQEGASYGSMCPESWHLAELDNRVRANLLSTHTYTVLPDIPSTAVGSTLTVTVRTDMPITMPFLETVLGSPTIRITATIKDTVLTSTCPLP